ncbi:T9SS type A sorting domain-containing protein [Flavobacterium sp.]|uniref:DUF7619 domain-containing protein n=1 Tax=Flavobacterium sp. TaxID=239 RepID=UPI0039E6815C
MKKIFFLLILFSNFVQAQIITIPDANFKAKLLEASPFNQIALNAAGESVAIDINTDGEIQVSEALQIHTLYLGYSFITSLEGISYFVNLRRLDVYNSQLSELDLTQNINLEYLYCQENQLTILNVSGLSNLKEVDCSTNQISILDIQNSITMKVLMCQDNLIEELNTTNLFQLEYLDCRLNQITNLDLSNSNTLNYLDCGNNQLSNLNIAGLENLVSVSCSGNLLTNLDLSLCNAISFLSCTNNQLTALDLSDLSNLNFLSCSENQLVELNVSMCTNITTLGCYNNSIEYLNLKNGNNSLTSYFFDGNPSIYVCANESQVLALQNYMNSNNIIGHVNSFCSFTPGGDYNTITGNARLDINNNGCEETDYSIPFFRLTVDLNAMTTNSSVFSNNNGVYNLYTVTEGVYTLTPVLENPAYFSVSPQPGTAIINEIDNSSTTLDFCVTANGVHPDLEVVIAPVTPARPGFEAVYKIVYKNKGNQILSQQYGVNFFYNQNLMQFLSASTSPSAQGAGGLQWDYANLMPFESRSIVVSMQINPPTDPENPVNIDDELVFTSVILPQAGDEIVQDNTFVFNQTVVGSYDPNDITCLQGDVVPPSEIGNYLHYVIRFENTGNAPAENVVVNLSINPAQYDAQSLQLLNTSHEASVRMNGQNLEVIFQNIQLESGGHGNILLKMKTKPTLQVGDMVAKKANIYFDYNFPIETNEAETLFQALSVVNPVVDNLISVYPNPVKDVVNITVKNDSILKTIELYDVQGRLLQTQLVNDVHSELNVSSRANGMYFIKINTDKGTKVEKLVKE